MADQAEQLMMAELPEPQEVSTECRRGVHQFRSYRQDQLFLPMDFSDMIAPHHVVRVVNDAVDQLRDAIFENVYPGGGRPPYHPKLMTKIFFPHTTRNIKKTAQLEQLYNPAQPLSGRHLW